MTESKSSSFLFESENEAGCSTKRSGDDEEEKSEWFEQENNETEFISCLLGEQFGEENRSGVPLKCFEYRKIGIQLSRVLENNVNMACQNELLSHETEIGKTNKGKCASSQSFHLTCHLLTICFLDWEAACRFSALIFWSCDHLFSTWCCRDLVQTTSSSRDSSADSKPHHSFVILS